MGIGYSEYFDGQETEEEQQAALKVLQKNEPKSVQDIIRRIPKGTRISFRDSEGNTPLHICVKNGNVKAVSSLMKRAPNQISLEDKNGSFPLHTALQLKKLEIALILIKETTSNLMISDRNENTPAHIAVETDQLEPLQAILAKFPKQEYINFKNYQGRTALNLAIIKGNVNAAKLLIEAGASVFKTSGNGLTPLHLASKNGNSELIHFLIEHSAVINATSKKGRSSLHMAAKKGKKESIEALLKYEPLLDVRDILGYSPLHYSAKFPELVPVVKIMLERGCNSNWKTKSGLTALDIAKKTHEESPSQQSQDMIDILEKYYTKTSEKSIFQLQICSDIHIEFEQEGILIPKAPMLALLGDIGLTKKKRKYAEYLFKQAEKFSQVFVLAGNHEFYHNTVHSTFETIEQICQKREQLKFLEKSSVLVNGIRILGATLWTKVTKEQYLSVSLALNDYRSIKIKTAEKDRSLTVQDTIKWHRETVKWLAAQIDLARTNNEKVVILTHHCPLKEMGCLHPEEYDCEYNSAFCTDLTPLFGPPVVAWLYGHTHWFNDVTIKGTRVISNPGGYPTEKMPFDPSFVVELFEE